MTKENPTECLEMVEKCYPEMKPYVGAAYDRSGRNGLMLVGESHYLCEATKCDISPDSWYRGDSAASLSTCDKEWINTSKILTLRISENFRNHPRNIWKKIAEEIASVLPDCESRSLYEYVYSNVVAFNFFVRPAIGIKSINHDLTDLDVEVAALRFQDFIRRFRPRAVIVLSSLVACYVDGAALQKNGIAYLNTPHPTSHWWNRCAKRYGDKDHEKRRGRELIAPFIKNLKLRWDV